eukprot:12359361-Karenia_brevis.AAC.1
MWEQGQRLATDGSGKVKMSCSKAKEGSAQQAAASEASSSGHSLTAAASETLQALLQCGVNE